MTMQLDIHSLVKKHQKIIPIALFGFSTLLAVVMLWKIVNFLQVSIWARDVVGKAVVQIGAQTPNVEQYLTIDRSIVGTLNQNNVFVPQATPVNPISEVRAIFGDSALINNNWYKAGDSVGQARIVAVEPTQAQIEWNGDVKTYLPVDATVIQTQQSNGRGTARSGTQASRTAVNLSAASQNIGATASSAGGGARIDSSTSARSARFGFQQGDVVLSINGMKVSSGDALTEVMNNIATGSAVTAQIIRNGVQMTIGRDTVANVGGTGSNRGGRGGTQTGRATGGRGN
jgi:S1-C subfamily serine protease